MDIRENDHRMLEPVLVKGLTWDQCDRAPEPVQLPAVVEPAVPDITDMIIEIKGCHKQVRSAFSAGFYYTIQAGELLIKLKLLVGHGNFAALVKTDLGFSDRTARYYMDAARAWALTPAEKRQRFADLSINKLMKSVKETRAKADPEVVDHIPTPAPTMEERLSGFTDDDLSVELRRRLEPLGFVITIGVPPAISPDRACYRDAMEEFGLSQSDFAKLGGIPTGSFQAYLSQPHRTLSDDQHASLAKVIADRRAA